MFLDNIGSKDLCKGQIQFCEFLERFFVVHVIIFIETTLRIFARTLNALFRQLNVLKRYRIQGETENGLYAYHKSKLFAISFECIPVLEHFAVDLCSHFISPC